MERMFEKDEFDNLCRLPHMVWLEGDSLAGREKDQMISVVQRQREEGLDREWQGGGQERGWIAVRHPSFQTLCCLALG